MSELKQRISFVLPMTLEEQKSDDGWRSHTDSAAKIRLEFLLETFVKMFDLEDLDTFFIVVPSSQIDRIAEIVDGIVNDKRFVILREESVCPELFHSDIPKIKGWYIQQLLKLAIHKYVTTPFYVTLDADIFCTRPFSFETLVTSGKAALNIETLEDYSSIYNDTFSVKEAAIKEERYKGSAAFLKYERVPRYAGRYYGETPVVIHTASVDALIRYLERLHVTSWVEILAKKCAWTEYGLYFQYLEMCEELEKFYYETDCNTLLDLEVSVWQPNGRYRKKRYYDCEHFKNATGCFVAIQSWVPVDSWVSPEYRDLNMFYEELKRCLSGTTQEMNTKNKNIFNNIYKQGLWGRNKNGESTSGSGSHKQEIIQPYIDAVKKILHELHQPSVVDLGCGDFNVGKNFISDATHFLACDVSDVILQRNRAAFQDANVTFMHLDLASDELPEADIAFVRQVLQHLDNGQIQSFVDRLNQYRPYKYLLVTEHQPVDQNFIPNVDIKTGADFRLPLKSGVQLDREPFNLNFISKEIILEVPEYGGIIRSFLFKLK